jgi:hypothetical protein
MGMIIAEASKLFDSLEKVAFLIVGGAITILVQRINTRINEKRGRIEYFQVAFRGLPESHRQMILPGLTNALWQSIPPEMRDHCITFVFFMESVGRAVIKDVRITVDAKGGSGIVAHQFQVARRVMCERLETKEVEDKRLIANWKYVNPGEEIELYVLVAGIDDPENVDIGIDAEGVEFRRRLMLQKSLQAMMVAGQATMSRASIPAVQGTETGAASLGPSLAGNELQIPSVASTQERGGETP